MTAIEGWVSVALTARAPLVRARAADVTSRITRRSTASPTIPPTRAPTMSGTSWARLTAPTWNEDRVRS